MRAFFLRELRRLAPISLGVLVLGALIVVGSVLLLPPGPPSLLDISLGAFAIVGVASAFLLGVATVAPDAESGAVAFLATLPVTRSRELAVRWGAALVSWGVAFAASAVLPVVLACAAPVEKAAHAVPETLGVVAAVGAAAFSAGAIGSMAVRRALVAVVVGPIFFLAPWFAYARLAQGLEAPTAFGAAAPFVIPPVLIVAAAFVFLRGDLHRSSFRPLALGSVVVGGALLLSCIATTGAFAYDRFFADWDVRLEAFHRTSARHVLYWKHREASWGKNARFTLNALDADTGRCLELAGGNVVSASPAGDRILVENYLLNRTELHELRTGDVRIGPPAAASLWQSVWNGLGAHPHLSTGVHESVAWAHGLPIAFAPGELQEWGKAGPRALPEGLVAEALAGSRVVLRRADGTLLLWDLERDLEHPERSLAISLAALPAGFTIHELVFSPLGGSLVVLGASDAGAAVYVLELGASPRGIRLPVSSSDAALALAEGADATKLSLREPGTKWIEIDLAFAPSESRLLVNVECRSYSQGNIDNVSSIDLEVVELATGEARALRATTLIWVRGQNAWSPDELHVVLGVSVLDLAQGTSRELPLNVRRLAVLCFLDDRRALVAKPGSGELEAVDLASGARSPYADWLRDRPARDPAGAPR